LQRISKAEMDFLIEHNILKQSKGKFFDQLVVTNRQGGKAKKQRYVTDPIYNYMVKLQKEEQLEKQKVDKT